jgi:hypothetical protein
MMDFGAREESIPGQGPNVHSGSKERRIICETIDGESLNKKPPYSFGLDAC